MLAGKRILLIITGGIAAYKSLELIRRLREKGASLRCILTRGGEQFVTPLSVSALSEEKVHRDLFSLTDEHEMGHIRLARENDLIVIAPTSADFIARMAAGRADDLATTVLLVSKSPVLIAPAMNVSMWENQATIANMEILKKRGVHQIGPVAGDLACGETGEGRMSEPLDILSVIEDHFAKNSPLSGRRAFVTSGPTHEAIDPVRYIANRSSGKQGHAIAIALARLGAQTTLISGPTALPDPAGVTTLKVETALEMFAAVKETLPVDVAVCAAAVADWRVVCNSQKIKKENGKFPALEFSENPDILAHVSSAQACGAGNLRPSLVVGFAAETQNVVEQAIAKRARKKCDWILANDVSAQTGTFGGDNNHVHFIDQEGVKQWPAMTKNQVAERLAERIADHLQAAK